MSNLETAYSNLCYKDPRHPDYTDYYGQDIEYIGYVSTPRKDCFCDNCFKGRDKLALIIIDLIENK